MTHPIYQISLPVITRLLTRKAVCNVVPDDSSQYHFVSDVNAMATQASSVLSPPMSRTSAILIVPTSGYPRTSCFSQPSDVVPGQQRHHGITPAAPTVITTVIRNDPDNFATVPIKVNVGNTVPGIVEDSAIFAGKEEDSDDNGRVDPKSGLNNCEIAGIIIGCILVFVLLVYIGLKLLVNCETIKYAEWERETPTIRNIRRWLDSDEPVPARYQRQMRAHFGV